MSLRALGALAGALLGVACSSDEPAAEGPLAPAAPSVSSDDPGALPSPRAVDDSAAPPTVVVPPSAPSEEAEPAATETNFKTGRDAGAEGDAGTEGDAGALDPGSLDAGTSDAGTG